MNSVLVTICCLSCLTTMLAACLIKLFRKRANVTRGISVTAELSWNQPKNMFLRLCLSPIVEIENHGLEGNEVVFKVTVIVLIIQRRFYKLRLVVITPRMSFYVFLFLFTCRWREASLFFLRCIEVMESHKSTYDIIIRCDLFDL